MTRLREPESQKDAEDHINQIRQDKGLIAGEPPNSNVSDLERALKIVSEELNHNSFHFLLEFIQNADDNAYADGVLPTLDVSYRGDFLRIDCNETGFYARNVESICKIGSSTKSGADKAKGYVGEKGIGFKSVFKVADIVYIASRHYTFMFEKSALLGMIAPVWSNLPAASRQGWTTFYLRLSKTCDKQALMKEINSLDPRMLIFLRKLRCINITIEADDGRVTRRTLSRLADDNGLGGAIVHLRHDNDLMRYIITRHRVENLPEEAKRLNIRQSEILLAFPIDEERQPTIKPQQVFAFLPIRDYSLQFLLQADFLLIASREDIISSSKWNRALRNAAVNALIEAGHMFNRGGMKYTWLRYLPLKGEVSGFFEPLKKTLLAQISNERLLENWKGDMARPSTLTFVSKEKFADTTGRPMTLAERKSNKASVYLSPKYSDADLEYLKALGVNEMSSEDFLRDLANYIGLHSVEFRGRSIEWHTRLAEVLIPLALNPTLLPNIQKLKLVHLRDERWVSVSEYQNPILFPGEPDGCEIPSGIDVLVVNQLAAANSSISQLYSSIGVVHFSVSRLFAYILQMHGDSKFDPSSISREALISQAAFLYSAGWRVNTSRRIWFVSESGDRVPASRLYIDSDEEYSASKFFTGNRNRFPFLHPEYLSAVPGDREGWLRWLVDHLNVAMYPRIQRRLSDDSSFDLSKEFEFLAADRSPDLLVLIKNRWDKYSSFIEKDENQASDVEPNLSRARLRKKLAAIKVKCENGEFYPLEETFLPLEELVSVTEGCVPFLVIPLAQDPRWLAPLRSLGVGIKDDLNLYLRALQSLKMNQIRPPARSTHRMIRANSVSLAKVSSLLEQIQARSSEDEALIKTRFRELGLLYVQDAAQDVHQRWLRPDECVWKGPTCMRKFRALSDIYPENRRLLCDILGVQDANLEHLVQQARELSSWKSLPHITELLLEVEKYIKDDTPESALLPLRGSNIFPVRLASKSSGFDFIARGNASLTWFIPDCTHLEESFRGKVSMLALSVVDTGRIKRLLRTTDVENRKLSNAAQGSAETVGISSYWEEYTASLRGKANSILRLVPDTETNRQRIFKQLRAVEAYRAPKVIQHWSVQYNHRTIVGEPESGHVALKSDETSLHIYFAEGSTETSRCKRELVERLSSFCGFSNATNAEFDRKYWLMNILGEDNLEEINRMLDRETVPPLASDDDLADEAEKKQIARQSQKQPVTKASSSATSNVVGVSQARGATGTSLQPLFGDMPQQFTLAGMSPSQIANLRFFSARDWDASAALNLDELVLAGPSKSHVSRLRVFGFGRRSAGEGSRIIVPDERTAFEGESIVSTLLGNVLGDRYEPGTHWTSIYRSRAGHSPYNAAANAASTFTLHDYSGVFTLFLISAGVIDPGLLHVKPLPTYHLEVKPARGSIDSAFSLTSAQFERARRFRMGEGAPTNVTILIRIFDMDREASLHMFVDIWECYLRDRLRLTSVDGFKAQIQA